MDNFLAPSSDDNSSSTDVSAADLLKSLLTIKNSSINESTTIQGIIIGHIYDIDDEARVWISHSNVKVPLVATSIFAINSNNINKQCALMFENGNPMRPIIMGLLQEPVITITAEIEKESIFASQSIELRCGKAAIVMNADGKIDIRGTKITSHSSGLNQILGASVKLN